MGAIGTGQWRENLIKFLRQFEIADDSCFAVPLARTGGGGWRENVAQIFYGFFLFKLLFSSRTFPILRRAN